MSENAGPKRVLLVDDRLMIREGLRVMIDAQPAMETLAAASTPHEASEIIREGQPPDVAIVGSALTGQLAFWSVRSLRLLWPNTRVVLLTSDPIDGIISSALCAQVDGIVTTSDSFQTLATAIVAVLAGRRYFTPTISTRLRKQRSARSDPPHLTAREFEVLGHLVTGRSVKETAAAMKLAVTTVDNHKTRIMRKVDVHNNVELTRYAIREGLATA